MVEREERIAGVTQTHLNERSVGTLRAETKTVEMETSRPSFLPNPSSCRMNS